MLWFLDKFKENTFAWLQKQMFSELLQKNNLRKTVTSVECCIVPGGNQKPELCYLIGNEFALNHTI